MVRFQIDRGTNDQPEIFPFQGRRFRNVTGLLRRILRNVRVTLNANFYSNIRGSFNFTNLPNKQGSVELTMPNAQSEYFVGKILAEDVGDFDFDRLPPAARLLQGLIEYVDTPFIASIQKKYLELIKFISAKRFGNKIVNPLSKRQIYKDRRTYKNIYKGIFLLKPEGYKDLSKYLTVNYKIESNCVVSWICKYLNKKFNYKKASEILGYEKKDGVGFTYPEIFKLCWYYNSPVVCRDIMGDVIDSQKTDPNKKTLRKKLDFIIHDSHMYVGDFKKKSLAKQEILIHSVEDIDKYKNKRLIVTTIDLYDEIEEYVKKNYILIDYDYRSIYYKSNLIKLSVNYVKDSKIIKKSNTSSRCVFNIIDNKLHLRGYMNNDVFKCFDTVKKIRIMGSIYKNNLQFDENKSYPAKLYQEGLIIPIPSIDDRIEKYNKNHGIAEWGFYYCTLKSYDHILAPVDDFYSGYGVNILKKEKRIKKIKYQFVCKSIQTLCPEILDNFDYDTLRCYIGWLMKRTRITSTTYDNIKGDEAKALIKKFKVDCQIVDDKLVISKEKLITKTGLLANILVKCLVNMALYNFNKKFTKANKTAVLNTIKTDSLGYVFRNKKKSYKTIDLIGDENEIGKFKLEGKPNYYFVKEGPNDVIDIDEFKKKKGLVNRKEPIIKEIKPVIIYKCKQIKQLLKDRKSFGLLDKGGLGKSYQVENTIIPYLKKHKLKYMLTSTTIENNKFIGGESTIQGVLKTGTESKNYLINKFKDCDYLIIDEMSQAGQMIYKYLEFVKNNSNCKFIFVGDRYQCKSVDAPYDTWLNCYFVLEMIDCNLVKLKWHKNARYDKELYDKLEFIIKNFNSRPKVLKYVLKNFKTTKKYDTDKHLSYFKDTRKMLIKKYKKDKKMCHTVHSHQGKTIDTKYTIHNITKMSTDIIYTALSRATSSKQILIKV